MKGDINMEPVNLSKESIQELATEITKRFLQGAESLFFEENTSTLSVILKDIRDSVFKRLGKEKKEKERQARFERINKQVADCTPCWPVVMDKPKSVLD